jgi:hypothetical protein
LIEQVRVEVTVMTKMIPYSQKNHTLGIVRPGSLRWVGPWLPKIAFGWQELKREMQPLKIRWGWALLLAMVLVLLMGECGPVASAVAASM